ncbi:MAG: SusC/RagA family TonB-linked outer membrane protein [Balneolaceae bacterium]|nr:SusC/RagA family TonB-linked outer membrane protein [Balneolaceae bacterium]
MHIPYNQIFKVTGKAVGLLSLLLCLAISLPHSAFAQGFDITGQVVDGETNDPIPGANIVEVGTQTGTVTNPDGEFSLTVSAADVQIRVSFIGYQAQTLNVDGRSNITIRMQQEVGQLDDLVVTAFGVQREERSLGYSVGRVNTEDFARVRSTNIGDNLSGQVAGLQVTSPPTGPAGSTRLVLRGVTSLTGNNEPLIVVDGVPMDNRTIGEAGEWGGFDGGEGLSALNPDDIADLTVLKGPSATALYGSRAQNGAIIVTTKSGAGTDGFSVSVRSNVTFENVLVGYDEVQEEFGMGSRGRAPRTQTEAVNFGTASWGEPIQGQQVVQFDGEMRPYVVNDNLRNFYDTGTNISNSIAVSGGTENSSFRLSVNRLNSTGIIPTSTVDRDNINFIGSRRVGDLTVEAKANYIIEATNFRPQLSDNPSNPALSLSYMPLTLDVRQLQNYKDEQGNHIPYNTGAFRPNPYWGFNENGNEDDRRRLIGFVRANYEIFDWLSFQARLGTDFYNLRRTTWDNTGTPWVINGQMNEQSYNVREDNIDAFFQLQRSITSDIGVNATFGAARTYETFEEVSYGGNTFIIPNLITIGNTTQSSRSVGYAFNEKQVNSLFGSAQFDYQNLVFLEITGRNDWSSTLPSDNNSYFYPSVNLSFSFAEALGLTNDWFNYGQFRTSWASVGGDTDPYQLSLTYAISGGHPTKDGGNAAHGGISGGQIPLADLKPTSTTALEAGIDLRFFDGRLGLDATVYQQTTSDQILATTISNASGFDSRVINAGEIDNSGIELRVTGRPVVTQNLQWDIGVNYARNRNEVVSLEGDLESLRLGISRSQHTFVDARVGEPYGQIVGRAYQRDSQGRVVHDSSGLPLFDNNVVLGNYTPDWTGSISNNVTFRNMSLTALVDIRSGGQIYSLTNAQMYQTGLHKNTIPGRSTATFDSDDNFISGGVVGEGVTQDGDTNTTEVDPQVYYSHIGANISEDFVYDASYVKLRSLAIGYSLPVDLVQRIGLSGASFSIVGRNLWLIHKNTPNIDPESVINTGNAQGLEHATLPSTRSFGFDISLQF